MAEETDFDCEHACCPERNNPYHGHFLGPEDCAQCARVQNQTAEDGWSS